MGMAASQVRFLQLTSRKADIGRQLQHLSLEKTALTRDMRIVTQNYQRALSAKSLKWSANSGVSYTDISYNTLMRPNEFNSKSPILITNAAGKVVIDEKYKKYAEMISPDGSVGGVYSGEKRLEILQALTGISSEQVQSYTNTANDVEAAHTAVDKAQEARDKIAYEDYEPAKFISVFMSASSLGLSGNVTKDNVDSIVSKLNAQIVGKDYFTAEHEEFFTEAAKACAEDFKLNIAGADSTTTSGSSAVAAIIAAAKKSSNSDTVELSVDDFISSVVDAFRYKLGNSDTIHVMYDKKTHSGTQSAYDAADQAYLDAMEAYNKALDANNQVYTADQTAKIDYYDSLFTAIVDNGWVYDGGVNDSEYLNQMFQNNQYFITTIEKNSCFDPDEPESMRNYDYTYSTDLASNFGNIFMVNDSDAREEALVEYEYKKQIINDKESRIDTRMKNLETEQSAISKMLESIDKTKEDNIDRTMGLWA